jgi:hypothetical protein
MYVFELCMYSIIHYAQPTHVTAQEHDWTHLICNCMILQESTSYVSEWTYHQYTQLLPVLVDLLD